MDAVIFISITLFLVIAQLNAPATAVASQADATDFQPEDVTRTAKINELYYEDPDAFMEIAHALGFPKEH